MYIKYFFGREFIFIPFIRDIQLMYLLIDLLLFNATGAVLQHVYDENKNTNNQYIGIKITIKWAYGWKF